MSDVSPQRSEEPPVVRDDSVTLCPHNKTLAADSQRNSSVHHPSSQRVFSPQTSCMTIQWFPVSVLPPPDLSDYIHKIDDQYFAGGGFGDVYRCRYLRDGSPPQEVGAFAIRVWLPPTPPLGCSKGIAIQVHARWRYRR